jgi:shikimate dehydrogenase
MTPYAEVIGDPIEHSKSPLIHRFWLEKLGLDGDYRATRVPPDELGEYFLSRSADPNWRGCNITMPHKLAALAHVHKHRDPSFPIEPINIAVPRHGRLEGANSDTQGLLEPLLALHGGWTRVRAEGPCPATVIGSGGVLFSVMTVLSLLGYAPIHVVVRDARKAEQIAEDYQGVAVRIVPWGAPLPPCALLVNATPLGMRGQVELPFDCMNVMKGGIVFDMVYNPVETRLLADARSRGLRMVDGLQMLVAQAASGFQLFFDAAAPRAFDCELRELLTA